MSSESPVQRRTLTVVKHPDGGGTIVSFNLSTIQLLGAIVVAGCVVFGALYEATKYAFQPFVDSRIEASQTSQALTIDREYAKKTELERLRAESDERWAAQYRSNDDNNRMLLEIRSDVKDLLRRQGRP